MTQDNDQSYFEYLRKRSRLGDLYRRHLLYPTLYRRLPRPILDYGCGIGDFLRYAGDAVGVDVNARNVDYCRELGLDARFVEKTARLPFESKSFHSALLDNVIEHIPAGDVGGVLDEIWRVLCQQGTLIVGVPGKKGYASDPDHKVYYSESGLTELLSGHAFAHRRTVIMPIPWRSLDRLISQYCVYGLFEKRFDRRM